jgi:hypothetical protein
LRLLTAVVALEVTEEGRLHFLSAPVHRKPPAWLKKGRPFVKRHPTSRRSKSPIRKAQGNASNAIFQLVSTGLSRITGTMFKGRSLVLQTCRLPPRALFPSSPSQSQSQSQSHSVRSYHSRIDPHFNPYERDQDNYLRPDPPRRPNRDRRHGRDERTRPPPRPWWRGPVTERKHQTQGQAEEKYNPDVREDMYREESSKRDDVYTFKDRLYQDPALMYAKLLDEILPKTMAISAQDAETGTFPLGAHLVYFPNRRVQGLAVDGAELSHVPDDFPLAKDYQEWEMAKQQAQEQGQEGEEDASGGESVPGGIRVWRGAVTKFKRGWRKAVCFRHPTPPVLYCREKAIPDERRSRSSIAAMMDADAADAADSDPSITFHDQTAATETGGGKEAGMKKTATTTTTKMVNVERVYSTGYAWRQRKGEKRLGTLPSSIWCEETRKLAFVSPTASAEAEKRIIRCNVPPYPSPSPSHL